MPEYQLTDWEVDAREVLEDNPDPIKVGHRWMQRTIRAVNEIRRLIAELRGAREDHEHVCVQRDAALSANRQLRDRIATLTRENEIYKRDNQALDRGAEKLTRERDQEREVRQTAQDLAEKLERERDEARAEVERLRGANETLLRDAMRSDARLKQAEAKLAKARELLLWLDQGGGLGLDKHARIQATLDAIDGAGGE